MTKDLEEITNDLEEITNDYVVKLQRLEKHPWVVALATKSNSL